MSDLLPAKQSSASPPAVPAGSPDSAYQSYGAYDDYAPAHSRSPIRLQRMLTFLLRFWWLPILTVLLGTAAGIAYVFYMPPTYTSTGRMWETEKLRLSEAAAFTEDAQTYYGTQMQLLQSDRMSQLAFESLLAAGTNNVPRDKDGRPLKVTVSVRQQPKSTMFVLQASSSNPTYAQAYLNSLMAVFQTYRRDIRANVSGNTWSSLSDQVKRLESDWRDDQAALAAFQKTNNLDLLLVEGTSFGSHLAGLKTRLSDLQLNAKLLEATALAQENVGGTNAAPSLADALPTTSSGVSGLGSATADRLVAFKELELLKTQREKLGKVYRPRHPKIARLDAEIERGQQLIELYRNQGREQLAASRKAVQLNIDSVESSIKEWEEKVVQSKSLIAEAERLKANVARSQSFYERLGNLLENVDISRNINQDTLAVLEPASTAQRSYKNEMTAVGLSAFLGLALGLGLVLLIEIRDDRFISAREVTDKFGDSIVGQVPEVRVLKNAEETTPLLDESNAPHMLAESYRSLRSALFYLPGEANPPRVILVTSALPDEGKSTVAANLAKTIAQGGARVLLLDGDLRRGLLHKLLGLSGEPGLSDLLLANGEVPIVSQSNGLANLTFVARGQRPNSPGDLLVGRRFGELLARWRQEFDFVIIDTCPVFAADDATTLAPKVDGTLFVVRRGYSGAKAVRLALELLAQRQAKILGLVFNRADPSARAYYYYKHQEYAATGEGQGAKG